MDDMAQRSDDRRPPESRLGFLLYRAGLAISRGYERALQPLTATPVEAGVLSVLAYEGPNHVRALGRKLGLGRQTIVNVAKSLVEAGLVERVASEADARLNLLTITKTGRSRLARIEQIATRFDQELRDVVGLEGERHMIEKLQKILVSPQFEHGE